MSPNNTVTVIERSHRPPPIDVSRGLFNVKKWLADYHQWESPPPPENDDEWLTPNTTTISDLITDNSNSPWLPVQHESRTGDKRGFDPLDEAVPAKRRRRDP